MSQEDFPVEFVLDGIEEVMPPSKQPKVILFDIGGVCVLSPFQAILDYELSHNLPPGWVNNCISKTKPYGYWHRLERGEMLMNATWFRGFNSDLHNPELWETFYQQARTKNPTLPAKTPPLPQVDGEALFWSMMAASRAPDPWMFPALTNLRKSGRYILAALSNTMIFPSGHPYSSAQVTDSVRSSFDVFISSAHVGMRKPDPVIYTHAIRELDAYSRAHGKGPVEPSDILFLDDIGENLKAGKAAGFQTIKVGLGKAFEAVDQLEEITGLKLAGDHPRVPVVPKVWKEGGAKL